VTIFAAASLTNAFNALGPELERQHPDLRPRFSYGASSALRSQIQLGAPVDVFASADYEQVEPLLKARLVSKPMTFARNRLTIVVPVENRAGLRSPKDLARPGLRLVSTSEAVPVGQYAQQALLKLAKLPGYPIDYASRVNAGVVSREPNVRSVLAKAELGEADAAIVYETDALGSRRVKSIPIPEKANVTAEYPISLVAASANRDGAERFVRFLRSERGRAVLKRFGFR
jgi:molybdate transport system substrate-binding protein